jgi:hypothetical protein
MIQCASMKLDPRRIEMVDEDMAAVLRRMTGAQRLKIAEGMFRSARQTIACFLKQRHPDWDDQQVQRETVRSLSHGAV